MNQIASHKKWVENNKELYTKLTRIAVSNYQRIHKEELKIYKKQYYLYKKEASIFRNILLDDCDH